ncbi:DJ-1/PfpI family protein [Paenibacillus sp. PAMC21692]|uniref:DJ-1/PfpI family protein n=1 Tax=Paenibacillus sp. PAMC21692 TaxID=2762320 RepID=UPI00164DA5B7|nr:DJ-1/PfpI family protein [Paenibacillus sp. PAMC21692]QNK56724.1 DJ-1/PfpI family protein [Paenibacillus sp. PAMC21692]
MLSVQIVLFDGFDLLDAIAPYEVFCAAAMYTDDAIVVELVTAEGGRSVASGVGGLEIEATGRLAPEKAGIIVVPGASGDVAGDGPDSVPTILARAMGTELTGLVERALERPDVVVATVCGGSLLLAMGGLLEGRPAVTHHLGMDALGATGAAPVQARVVDDGNLVSGGGVTSGLDVALHLVERELGPRIAHAVERLFEYERRGTVWRAAGPEPDAAKLPSSVRPGEPSPLAAPNSDEHAPFAALNSGGHAVVPASRSSSSDLAGNWETIIATPVGKMPVLLSIIIRDGVLQGTATQGDETVELIDPDWQNNRLTWSLRVTKPMRLNLKFEVAVNGDVMTGIAKAGILPASKVTGKRVTPGEIAGKSEENHQ